MDITRRTVVLDLPRNLIINIRRFKYTYYGISKDSSRLQFPLRLCMDRFRMNKVDRKNEEEVHKHREAKLLQSTPEDVYELYGVVSHSGGVHGGHYICYVSYTVGNHKTW